MNELHRPYIRKSVIEAVETLAPKDDKGRFLDAHTLRPIEGQYDLGHKTGHEFRTEKKRAEQEGLTQAEFNTRMNNPVYYQIEDPHENRSHIHEEKGGTTVARINEQSYEAMIAALYHFANTVYSAASEMQILASGCAQGLGEEDKAIPEIYKQIKECQLKYAEAVKKAKDIAAAMQEELDDQRKEDQVWASDDVGE